METQRSGNSFGRRECRGKRRDEEGKFLRCEEEGKFQRREKDDDE
jgi:hypothetical protein